MMRGLFRSALFLALTFSTGASLAQNGGEHREATDRVLPAPTEGTVIIETNLPGGIVYDGDVPLGPAEAGFFVLAPGTHRLTLREAEPEAWRPRMAEAEVEVVAGDVATVRLDVPYRYRIESFPYGAVVTLEGEEGVRRLGETPLDYESDGSLDGTLVVEKAGYAAAEQTPGEAADNRYSFVLRPLDFEAGTTEVALHENKKPNHWIDVAAVGLALGAGALAVHYKFKGDDEYEAYARSGDPEQRDDFERYDTYSAIALGAMQVGIGVFAIRLVLR
jgi:hypothetical protein